MTIVISNRVHKDKAFRDDFIRQTENGRRLKTRVAKSKKIYSRKNLKEF